MGKHVLTVLVAVIIAVSLLLYMFAFQVRTSEAAIILTFGEASTEPVQPGYHFKWPWPIQEVRKFDNRVHVEEGRIEESFTNDRFNILASVSAGWKIKDVYKFNQNFGKAENPAAVAWPAIERIVRDRTQDKIGSYKLNQLVSLDPALLKYDEIEEGIRAAAAQQSSDIYGIDIVFMKLRRLELPEAVTKKVFERMKEERTREATRITEAGKQEAAIIRSDAEAQKQQILSLAKAQAEAIRGEGDAKAAEYYSVFAENPALAIFLRKVRALSESTKENTTLVLDTSTAPFDLLTAPPPDVSTNRGLASEIKTQQ